MLDEKAIVPWANDVTEIRTALQRSRQRFQRAADALRSDVETLKRRTRWKDGIRNRPGLSLAVALLAGAVAGAVVASKRGWR